MVVQEVQEVQEVSQSGRGGGGEGVRQSVSQSVSPSVSYVTPSILSVPLMPPFCLGWQEVRLEMLRGFLASLGSVPTGGRGGL